MRAERRPASIRLAIDAAQVNHRVPADGHSHHGDDPRDAEEGSGQCREAHAPVYHHDQEPGGDAEGGQTRAQAGRGRDSESSPIRTPFTAKTSPAQFPVTTFGRHAGALAGALAAVRDRILAEGEEKAS